MYHSFTESRSENEFHSAWGGYKGHLPCCIYVFKPHAPTRVKFTHPQGRILPSHRDKYFTGEEGRRVWDLLPKQVLRFLSKLE